jgi:hypothetical protein
MEQTVQSWAVMLVIQVMRHSKFQPGPVLSVGIKNAWCTGAVMSAAT